MIKVGNVLKSKLSGKHYVVREISGPANGRLETIGYDGNVGLISREVVDSYEVFDSVLDVLPVPLATPSALDTQHGGDHYKKSGEYQPWQVLKAWLSEEEFKGYMKGSAIAYLAREKDKGGDLDIQKATHTLRAFLEMKDERL